LPDSEDDVQRALHTLYSTTKQYRMKISGIKSKVMTFKGQIPIRNKVVMGNSKLEQRNNFIYLV
jgi:hypothetical protein